MPPKIVPCPFVSRGSIETRIAGSWAFVSMGRRYPGAKIPRMSETKSGLFLGRTVDPLTGKTGADDFRLDPSDLTTHGLIVGMTGSGKTALGIVMIEELLQRGVPVLAIDPKGDLGNLLLDFPNLAPGEFAPFVDPS